MSVHNFNREKGEGIHAEPRVWNIGHPREPMTLRQRVQSEWPDKIFTLKINGQDIVFNFDIDLTPEEETKLSQMVQDQKNEVDWPREILIDRHEVVLSDDAKITVSGFHDFENQDYFKKGFAYSVQLNQPYAFSEKFAQDMSIMGGGYTVHDASGAVLPSDFVEMELVDKDNVLGFGNDVVLFKFIETDYVYNRKEWEITLPDARIVPAGVYLRVTYHPDVSPDSRNAMAQGNRVMLQVWYHMRHIPEA